MPARLRQLLLDTGIVLALAAGFTFFGVYGTDGPLWARFLMWVVTIGTGAASSSFIIPFVFGTRFEPWPLALRICAGAALIALPVTLSLILIDLSFGARISLSFVLIRYLYVLAVCLVLVIGGYILALAQQAPPRPAGETSPDASEDFLARLPVKYRTAELWAVSSEDHYLRVHTSAGEELILMRLADAVRELGGADGLQVHRSWWIARAGIRDTRRDNGKLSLILPSGREVPVSRTYLNAVREAGYAA